MMRLFSTKAKTDDGNPAGPAPRTEAPTEARQLDLLAGGDHPQTRCRTGRSAVYAVRVRESFKGEILALQAELQLERQKVGAKAKKVTEGEVIELMLEAFRAARRNGDGVGLAVPIANDVWQAVHELSRRLQCSPAAVVERLVVAKVAELNLLPRR